MAAIVAIAGMSAASAEPTSLEGAPLVLPFSTAPPGPGSPRGWEMIRLSERKRLTHYDVVSDHGAAVLRARAEGSASVLAYPTTFDIRAAPVVGWRWKVGDLIPDADNRFGGRDDSPARVIFAFDGNKSRLPLTDRAVFLLARAAGHDLPYATLMYVWSNDQPVGALLPNPHTRRVQMVVAASGAKGVGAWQSIRRNLLDDFRRAFGEEPGRMIAVGVMTDTDNTGAFAEAWYGDIGFSLPDP